MTVSKFKGNNVFIIFSRRSSRVAGLEQQEETAGDSIRVRVCPRIPIRDIFRLLPAGPRNTAPFPDARVLQGTKYLFSFWMELAQILILCLLKTRLF